MFQGKPFDAQIDVVFTVIHHNAKGKVSQEVIEKQMQVLQEGFDRRDPDSGFTFTLRDVVYENNKQWYAPASAAPNGAVPRRAANRRVRSM